MARYFDFQFCPRPHFHHNFIVKVFAKSAYLKILKCDWFFCLSGAERASLKYLNLHARAFDRLLCPMRFSLRLSSNKPALSSRRADGEFRAGVKKLLWRPLNSLC